MTPATTDPEHTILMIASTDDSIDIYQQLLAQDAEVSYRVLTKRYDDEILALCQSRPIDSILLDFHSLDGRCFEILAQLNAQLADRCPPMIVINGNDAEMAVRSLKSGAVNYLVKEQLTADKLCQALRNAISLGGVSTTENIPITQSASALQHIESAASFRMIANIVPDLLWCNDPQGVTLWYNQRWLDYTGQTFEQACGYGWLDAIHPDDRTQSLANFQAAVEQGHALQQEHRIRSAAGKYRWFLIRAEPQHDRHNQIICWFGSATDVHDQRAVLESLRQSEGRLQALIANLPGGAVFVVDRHLRYLIAEGEALSMAGFKPEDFVGRTIFEALPPELATSYEKLYRQGLAGEPFEHEHHVHNRSFISRGTPLRSPDGEIYAVLAVSYDVTDRKRAEVALRESEEKYRTLVDSIEAGFNLIELLYDQAGNVVDYRFLAVNQVFEQRTGLKDVVGKLGSEIAPNTESHWLEAYDSVVQTGEPIRIENYNEDTGRWYLAYSSRFGDVGSRQVATIFDDITDRKRHEANLAFLAEISQDLAHLTSIDETMDALGEKIAAHLGLSACAFAELNETAEIAVINHGWHRSDVPSLVGTYRMEEFVTPEILQRCRAGAAVVIRNVFDDPMTDSEQYAALNIGSFVSIPLVRNGEWRFLLVIYHSEPHDWRDDEIELTHELANRIWTRLERARAEVSLAASEEKYRLLFASINEGYALCELLYDAPDTPIDWKILQVNPAFETLTGLTNAAGKWGSELNQPLNGNWLQTLGTVARTGEATRFEQYIGSLDYWFEILVSRLDEDKHHIIVVFNNITDRKRAEAALRKSEERQSFLLKLSDALRSLADPVDIQQTVTHTAMNYFEADRCYYCEIKDGDAIILRDASREDLPSVAGTYPLSSFAIFQAVVDAGRPFVVQDAQTTDLLDEDLRQLCIQLQVISFVDVPVIKNGKPVGIFCLVQRTPRDWTDLEVELAVETADRTWAAVERARAEQAVAADLRCTTLLHDLATRLISETDIQVLHNEIVTAAIELMEAEAGSLQVFDETTQELVLLAAQGSTEAMNEHFRRVAASSGTSCGVALRNGIRSFVNFDVPESDDPDGSLRIHLTAGLLSAQSTPLITRSGKAIGMVSTHWRCHYRPTDRQLRFLDLLARQAADLIEQRQAEAERSLLLAREQVARAEAERANRIKDEFLSILSHELRSPLNPILGWSRLLQTKSLGQDKITQALSTIERNVRLQTQLVDDLLDVARVLRGKLSLNEAAVNLVPVIEAALEVVRTAAEAKSIMLHAELIDVGYLRGDTVRLQQIVWNLLSNAIKFTPSGGRVEIGLRQVVGDGEVESSSPSSYAEITVTDTGKGISREFLPHIFESFRQEDTSITRQYGGLGLGLAIVKYLVDAHGGTIAADSPGAGQGATFTVRFPLLRRDSMTLVVEPSLSTNIDLTGMKVLAVDDSEDARELLVTLLTQYGAETKVVTSGEDVLAQLTSFQPMVLVCDIGMPDMDGYTLIQQVRSLHPRQGGRVPAIALTAYATEEDRQRVLRCGFQKHIVKPLEPDTLAIAIAELVRRNLSRPYD
ncbi:GAF domain-containing protein [Thermocoleostomius sinensis]|uniref:Circadian input-output histidine kinase CikA n=1 Tax=Thermocoleostomius sinensis A174 TaxID=2016057 RepID=A0A9E8ZCU8_9CYAN|nr:GAF domain-containing protein [Thermocoleostomius sinensis]WAL59502.1 GAF domain-containing protein [Thermocoleostomius sinensis A174]